MILSSLDIHGRLKYFLRSHVLVVVIFSRFLTVTNFANIRPNSNEWFCPVGYAKNYGFDFHRSPFINVVYTGCINLLIYLSTWEGSLHSKTIYYIKLSEHDDPTGRLLTFLYCKSRRLKTEHFWVLQLIK